MEGLRYNTLSEFAKGVQGELEKRYGVTARIRETTKNNNVRYTYVEIVDSKINNSPAIYLDEYYKVYCEEGFESSLTKICHNYEKYKLTSDIDVSFISEYGKIRGRLGAKLINYDMNANILSNIPHMRFLDMAVIAYIEAGDLFDKEGSAIITVNNDLLNMWDIETDRLMKDALNNIKDDVVIRDLFEVIKSSKLEGTCIDDNCMTAYMGVMYVMSNKTGTNGAISLINKPILQKFAMERGVKTLYIIPCSVHEIILLVDCEYSVEFLREMVITVNGNELPQEYVLSNNVYVYNVKDNDIKIA